MLRDEARKISETLTNVEFSLAWPSISRTFAATGRFDWHDEPIDATLSLTDFVAALAGDRSGLKVRLAGAPFKFAFDGNISHRPTLKIEGTLAADTASLRDTLRWAGRAAARRRLRAFRAQGADQRGRRHHRAVGRQSRARRQCRRRRADLRGRRPPDPARHARGRGARSDALRFHHPAAHRRTRLEPRAARARWPRGIDVDLRLSAARVTLGNAKLGRTAVAANLRGGNSPDDRRIAGLRRRDQGLVRAREPTPAPTSSRSCNSPTSISTVLGDLFGVRRVEGKGDLGFALDGTGASVYALTRRSTARPT